MKPSSESQVVSGLGLKANRETSLQLDFTSHFKQQNLSTKVKTIVFLGYSTWENLELENIFLYSFKKSINYRKTDWGHDFFKVKKKNQLFQATSWKEISVKKKNYSRNDLKPEYNNNTILIKITGYKQLNGKEVKDFNMDSS